MPQTCPHDQKTQISPNQTPGTVRRHTSGISELHGSPLYGANWRTLPASPSILIMGGAPALRSGLESTGTSTSPPACSRSLPAFWTWARPPVFNALSRHIAMPLVAFYGRFRRWYSSFSMLAGVFLLVPGLGDMLCRRPAHWYRSAGGFPGFLLWGTRVVRSANDALSLTVPGELLLAQSHHHSGAVLVGSNARVCSGCNI